MTSTSDERIEAISCRYEHHDRAMYPVAGTTQVALRDEATGWEPEPEPEPEEEDLRFLGYIATVAAE